MIKLNLVTGQSVELADNFTLGELLLWTRNAMDLKQHAFASLLGLSGQSLISRVERGLIALNNVGFINLLKLYDYNGFCDIVHHFARDISFSHWLIFLPEPSELWFVEVLIRDLCFDLSLSRLKLAQLLSIEYHTFLKMSKGYKMAGNYRDICTVISSFKQSSGVYQFLRTY